MKQQWLCENAAMECYLVMKNKLYDYPVGRPPIHDHEKILNLRRSGHTYDAISYLCNDIHRSTIASICQKAGLGGRVKFSSDFYNLASLIKGR